MERQETNYHARSGVLDWVSLAFSSSFPQRNETGEAGAERRQVATRGCARWGTKPGTKEPNSTSRHSNSDITQAVKALGPGVG